MGVSTREPRMAKGTFEERAQRLRDVLDKVLPKVSTEPPIIQGRTSAVDIVLAAKRDEIERALKLGYRPGTIARLIHEADDVDAPAFSKETIRLAIVKMAKGDRNPSEVSRPMLRRGATNYATKPSPSRITVANSFANAARRP